MIILARGGGSIEDLWAFNHEQLAYAIAKSTIPIVSGVGHETDVTIADFVADLRAATPTAAAEAVSPNRYELLAIVNTLLARIQSYMARLIQQKYLLLKHSIQKLSSPAHLIQSHWQNLDYLQNHLSLAVRKQLASKNHQCQLLMTRLSALHPSREICASQLRIQHLEANLIFFMQQLMQRVKQEFETQLAALHAFSPLGTLSRGYAIVSFQEHVLMDNTLVTPGDVVNIKLAQGELSCEVLSNVG